MTVEQVLLQEIEESKGWLNTQKEESTYKRDPLDSEVRILGLEVYEQHSSKGSIPYSRHHS